MVDCDNLVRTCDTVPAVLFKTGLRLGAEGSSPYRMTTTATATNDLKMIA